MWLWLLALAAAVYGGEKSRRKRHVMTSKAALVCQIVVVLYRIWPKPTLIAWKLIASYAAFESALQPFLPGERVTGPVSPVGNVPVYKANEVAALSFASFYISRFAH